MTNILRNRWVQGGVAAAILGVIAFAYTTLYPSELDPMS